MRNLRTRFLPLLGPFSLGIFIAGTVGHPSWKLENHNAHSRHIECFRFVSSCGSAAPGPRRATSASTLLNRDPHKVRDYHVPPRSLPSKGIGKRTTSPCHVFCLRARPR